MSSTHDLISPIAPRPSAVLAVQRLVLRLRGPRLRRLAAHAYRGVARATSAYLTSGARDVSAYIRGGLGSEDFVPGLSDVDLAIVFGGDPRRAREAAERARSRWQRLRTTLPAAQLLLDWPRIYDEAELRNLSGASAFTFRLEDLTVPPEEGGVYFGDRASLDGIRMLERPGLYGETADWQLLNGRDRRPHEPERGRQARRTAAWLELLYWWRLIFRVCVDPTTPRAADVGVKLVAEPARIWLWLAHGERTATRAEALRRVLMHLPEEEEPLHRALDEQRGLPSSLEAPLPKLLPLSLRLSARIAELIAAEVEEENRVEVRIAGLEPAELIVDQPIQPLPLVDWRAIASPELPDESFVPFRGDPGDPAVLGAAAKLHPSGAYPALLFGRLMVMPAVPWRRTRLRAIKCPVVDPVAFALAQGKNCATFYDVRGWSAADTAHRAVAEHRAWLHARREPGEPSGHQLGRLLTATRAALFLESIREGDPELCATVTEAARHLAARRNAHAQVTEEALEQYRELARRGGQPSQETATALRRVVLELPSYRSDP